MTTPYTFDADLFSDFYKETHGFRPRSHAFYNPATSDDERQKMWDALMSAHDREMERYQQEQLNAISQFETSIDQLIKCGAKDRETAIRWIRDAQDEIDQRYGDDYLEFLFGLPYGYLKKEATTH